MKVVAVQFVDQAKASRASRGEGGSEFLTVIGVRNRLTEFRNYQNLTIGAVRQQLLIVGVHGQLGGVAVVRAVLDVLAVAVLLQVVSLQSDVINLALFERQHLGRVVGNAGHLVVVRLILADVEL